MPDSRTDTDTEMPPTETPLISAAGLTDRQRAVYERARDGQRVPAIARELGVSENTVRDVLSQIRRKVALALRRAEQRAAQNASPPSDGG